MFTQLISGRRPAGPRQVRAAIALGFSACVLLITGALTADAAGPDMRGSWALDVTAGGSRSVQTLEVTSMDTGSGAFGGDIIYSAQRASVAGTVSGTKVRFHSTPTSGSAADWAGDLSGNGVALKMSGTVTPASGQSGTFSGSRVAAAVPLDAGGGTQSSGRPALPPGGREVSPGQLPRQCTTGETGLQGYYFSSTAKQWVAAPFCYLRWGNLEASGSQVVPAGASVTVTAIPTDGSNSGSYAPQTGSIHWTYPGQAVSGCGAADLTCTAIPTRAASTEWQWFEFHVTMPRTFFIDSPGDLCGGQHLCAGATTNAWSYAGVAPGTGGSAQAPGAIAGGGAAGGQGTGAGGGGGPSADVIAGMAAVIAAAGIGATVIAASRNPMGAPAAVLARVGDILSNRRGEAGKARGGVTSPPGPVTGKGGSATGKGGGGISAADIDALGQQFQHMQNPTPPPPPSPPATPPEPPVSPGSQP